jgi:hypothetical protein
MADAPQGLCFWPGVGQVLSASFTISHGICPSVCTMEILPQAAGVAEYGDLVFTFGDTPIVFTRCKVDRASFHYDQQGLLWQLSIFDRRWKWAFGQADYSANDRHPGIALFGSIDARTEFTPQQIAQALLFQMYEDVYDVSQLPDETRPEVVYDAANPASSLQDLCDSLGCSICIGLDDVVRVVRNGVGAALPDSGLMSLGQILDVPEVPDRIRVVGAKTEYQADFILEAVGKDVDGVIRPINELSYTPAVGWANVLPWDGGFLEVAGWEVDPLIPANLQRAQNLGWVNPRELARETVFKWYRIQMTSFDRADKGPVIPGWSGERISALRQILPINDVQVDGWYDPSGTFHPYPAWVYGYFWDWQYRAANSPEGSFYHYGFSIDRDTGIVRFEDYCVFDNGDGTRSPASLFLRTGVNVKALDSLIADRYVRETATGLPERDTGPRVVRREEILRWVIPDYDAVHAVRGLRTSDEFCDSQADYYTAAALLEYRLETPLDATYMGLVPIQLDGAIRQVTWTVGPQGAETRASRNTEWNPAVPNYRERLLIDQLRRAGPRIQELQDQQRKG